MRFFTEVLGDNDALYAVFGFTDEDIALVKKARDAVVLLDKEDLDIVSLHLDSSVEVTFLKDVDEELAPDQFYKKLPEDHELRFEENCVEYVDGVHLVIMTKSFFFLGFGDDGAFETPEMGYDVLGLD